MSRLVRRPVQMVLATQDGTPGLFAYRGEQWQVRAILQVWKRAGRWWLGEGETTWHRVRARAGDEVIYGELVYDHRKRRWTLWRIWD